MRPHDERRVFFNGRRWTHRTDGAGFRNPEDRPAVDVVLLGDSMVYGHGVEEPATIRHHLEAALGRPVANLGVQGASVHEEMQIFFRHGLGLRPRHAFLFFLANDLDDLARVLSDDEMGRFLAAPPGPELPEYLAPRPDRAAAVGGPLRRSWAVRALGFLRARLGLGEAAAHSWEGAAPFAARPRRRLAMRFELAAIDRMARAAAAGGASLAVVAFRTEALAAEERIYVPVIERFCAGRAVAFRDLGRDLPREPAERARWFLPADGHLSDRGARGVAEVLAAFVREGAFPAPVYNSAGGSR